MVPDASCECSVDYYHCVFLICCFCFQTKFIRWADRPQLERKLKDSDRLILEYCDVDPDVLTDLRAISARLYVAVIDRPAVVDVTSKDGPTREVEPLDNVESADDSIPSPPVELLVTDVPSKLEPKGDDLRLYVEALAAQLKVHFETTYKLMSVFAAQNKEVLEHAKVVQAQNDKVLEHSKVVQAQNDEMLLLIKQFQSRSDA